MTSRQPRVHSAQQPRLDDPSVPLSRRGELASARVLEARGWRLLGYNVRTRCGEIDLIVAYHKLWVAVEVKTRSRQAAPERCVTAAQIHRVTAALQACATTSPRPPRYLRVDVAAVRPLGPGPLAPLEITIVEAVRPMWDLPP